MPRQEDTGRTVENCRTNQDGLPCIVPSCKSKKTKFRFFNNKKKTQPRYQCLKCKKFWTMGGKTRAPYNKRRRGVMSNPAVADTTSQAPITAASQPPTTAAVRQSQRTHSFLTGFPKKPRTPRLYPTPVAEMGPRATGTVPSTVNLRVPSTAEYRSVPAEEGRGPVEPPQGVQPKELKRASYQEKGISIEDQDHNCPFQAGDPSHSPSNPSAKGKEKQGLGETSRAGEYNQSLHEQSLNTGKSAIRGECSNPAAFLAEVDQPPSKRRKVNKMMELSVVIGGQDKNLAERSHGMPTKSEVQERTPPLNLAVRTPRLPKPSDEDIDWTPSIMEELERAAPRGGQRGPSQRQTDSDPEERNSTAPLPIAKPKFAKLSEISRCTSNAVQGELYCARHKMTKRQQK